jgi:hypothetical protein
MIGYCYAVSFMLTVVYTECHKLTFMLYAYMLNIVMLSVVLPFSLFFRSIKDKKVLYFSNRQSSIALPIFLRQPKKS